MSQVTHLTENSEHRSACPSNAQVSYTVHLVDESASNSCCRADVLTASWLSDIRGSNVSPVRPLNVGRWMLNTKGRTELNNDNDQNGRFR